MKAPMKTEEITAQALAAAAPMMREQYRVTLTAHVLGHLAADSVRDGLTVQRVDGDATIAVAYAAAALKALGLEVRA
jgi:hypothetical protein